MKICIQEWKKKRQYSFHLFKCLPNQPADLWFSSVSWRCYEDSLQASGPFSIDEKLGLEPKILLKYASRSGWGRLCKEGLLCFRSVSSKLYLRPGPPALILHECYMNLKSMYMYMNLKYLFIIYLHTCIFSILWERPSNTRSKHESMLEHVGAEVVSTLQRDDRVSHLCSSFHHIKQWIIYMVDIDLHRMMGFELIVTTQEWDVWVIIRSSRKILAQCRVTV